VRPETATLDLTRDFAHLKGQIRALLIYRSHFHFSSVTNVTWLQSYIVPRSCPVNHNSFNLFNSSHAHIRLSIHLEPVAYFIFSSPNPFLESRPPQIFCLTSTTRSVAIFRSSRITRIGMPIFTPCFSPRLPTTNDHSSFTLMTLPSIKPGSGESGASFDLATRSFVLRSCVSTSIRACARHPATSSNTATSLRSGATSGRDNHRVPFCARLKIAHRAANAVPASHDPYSPPPDPAPPSAIPNRNICGGTIPPLVGLPRLLVNTLSDSCRWRVARRICSFCVSKVSASLRGPHFQFGF